MFYSLFLNCKKILTFTVYTSVLFFIPQLSKDFNFYSLYSQNSYQINWIVVNPFGFYQINWNVVNPFGFYQINWIVVNPFGFIRLTGLL